MMSIVELPLRFEVTLAGLNAMARTATHSCGPMGSDVVHRYELAWMAIAETLYTVEEPPRRSELIWAGRRAIYDDVRDYSRHNGVFRKDMSYGEFSSPAFWRFWWNVTVPSHEDTVVEKMALRQILAALSPVRREAIVALATFTTHERAAMALGISYRAFVIRLNHARADFRRLWLGG